MPTTFEAVVILVALLVPGIMGEAIFARAIRADPSENAMRIVLRIAAVSVLGLICYVAIALLFGLPMPPYLLVTSYSASGLTALSHNVVRDVLVPYLGHIMGGIIVGMFAVPCSVAISVLYRQPKYESAWDAFCLLFAQTADGEGRWLQVRLVDGSLVMGILSGFDAYDRKGDRDLVIQEPAYWDDSVEDYVAYPLQSLFLPADQIASVSVIYDPMIDARLTEVTATDSRAPTEQEGGPDNVT